MIISDLKTLIGHLLDKGHPKLVGWPLGVRGGPLPSVRQPAEQSRKHNTEVPAHDPDTCETWVKTVCSQDPVKVVRLKVVAKEK